MSLSLSTPSLISHTTLGTAIFLNSIFPEKPLTLPAARPASVLHWSFSVYGYRERLHFRKHSGSKIGAGYSYGGVRYRTVLKAKCRCWKETEDPVNMDSDWRVGLLGTRNSRTRGTEPNRTYTNSCDHNMIIHVCSDLMRYTF
jgi:hypothetical protein